MIKNLLLGLIVVLPLSLLLATQTKAAVNLITNPSFEAGWGATPSAWYIPNEKPLENIIERVTDVIHSGSYALKMVVTNPDTTTRIIKANSNWMTVNPGAYWETSMWLNATNITGVNLNNNQGWYYVRWRVEAFDETKTIPIQSWNFGAQEGSSEGWQQIKGHLIVPEQAKYLVGSVWISYATGTIYVDDVDMHEVLSLPAPDQIQPSTPLVIPHPWQQSEITDTLVVESVMIDDMFLDTFLTDELREYFEAQSIAVVNTMAVLPSATILLRDGSGQAIQERLAQDFPNTTFTDLGEEGYLLYVERGSPHQITIAGNSAKGRFYGIQSLKQLLKAKTVPIIAIADKPTLPIRGFSLPAEWWNIDHTEIKVATRSAEVKYNYIWHQGEEFSYKLATKWRDPFTSEDLEKLHNYIQACKAHFIDCYFSMRPRGLEAPLSYSSETDINILVNKMVAMYEQGVRGFGLSFDDLEYFGEDKLLVEADQLRFDGHIGRAQAYLITEVFNRLKTRFNDITFQVVPLKYQRSQNYLSKQKLYLQHLSTIPTEIAFLSSEYFDEDIDTFMTITQHKLIVWDNLYAFTYANKQEPEMVVPFVNPANWNNVDTRPNLQGFASLPRTFMSETSAGISWYTMADFSWRPGSYNPSESFQRTIDFTQEFIPSDDINADGFVDFMDILILIRNFTTTHFNSDLNRNGIVDIFDFNRLVEGITAFNP